MAGSGDGRDGGRLPDEEALLAERLRAEADATLFAGVDFPADLRAAVWRKVAAETADPGATSPVQQADDDAPRARVRRWHWGWAVAGGTAVAGLLLAVALRWALPGARPPGRQADRLMTGAPAETAGTVPRALDSGGRSAAPGTASQNAPAAGFNASSQATGSAPAAGGPIEDARKVEKAEKAALRLAPAAGLQGSVALAAGGDEFAPGDPVPLRIALRNGGEEGVLLGGQAPEVVVRPAGRSGREWRQALPALAGRRLGPGEELAVEAVVRAPAGAGWYYVTVAGVMEAGGREYSFGSATRLFLVRGAGAAQGERVGDFRTSAEGVTFVVERVVFDPRETRVVFRIPGLRAPAGFRLTLERQGAPAESDLELRYSGDDSGVRGEAVFNPLPALPGSLRVILGDLSGSLDGRPVSLPGPWAVTIEGSASP